jgi:uncharacterized membrane protein
MTRRRLRRGLAALVVVSAPLLGSCAGPSTAAAPEAVEPAHVEPAGDEGINRITLEEQAVTRLDLQTGEVREGSVDGQQRLLVRHSAIVYDADGRAWAYTVVEGLTYERAPVEVDQVVGEDAFLTSGPPVGTEVVTVGVAELYGAEHDVGH